MLDGERVGVRCEDGAIAAIGAEVAPAPGDETIDAAGMPLVPALVNGHTHVSPLTPGAPADFLLLRGDSPELGIGELASDLVYAANGSVVDTTVVAGHPLMRGGEVEGMAEIVARARERAQRLGIA